MTEFDPDQSADGEKITYVDTTPSADRIAEAIERSHTERDDTRLGVPKSLAFWCTLLLFLIVMSPWVVVLLMLPGTGPAETKALMGPVLSSWTAFASPVVLVLGAVAGYDKFARSSLAEKQLGDDS